ncbi:SH3 and PX domain-containing 2B isoform X4, partial [Paramuricea clavata]
MSSSLSHSSTYGPSVNNGTNLETDGIPLIIVAASAAGAGIVFILIIILCCCCHRRLKRKKNERIFQKYYRPTIPCNSSHDLEVEDDNSNMWASQTKLSIENKDEQSIHPKPHQGISNKAFTTSESLPEMNIIQEKLPPDLPIDIPNDAEQSISNKVEALNIQEINKSGEDDPGPVQKMPEKVREIDKELPAEENSPLCDDDRASLLVLQNLDKVLNNECINDVNTPEEETSDGITSFTDDQEKKDDVEYFVVIYPFQTSNTDEISLDVGTTVSVIDNKPSGWSWVANQDGDTGWFPTRYLALVDTDNDPEESGDVQTNHQIGYSIPDQRRLKFAVLESFSATSPDELSLAKYEIVSVIENSSSGWSWVNEPSVGSGWFPTNYLEPLVFPKKNTRRLSNESSTSDYLDIIVDEDTEYIYASSEEIQKVKKEGHYQEYEAKAYRASHTYTGGNEDELTFKENETILVLQETKTGWWRGSTYLGEGWFPATFVE